MPTENRSSNTEMVSVPPYIGLEPLVGRYYPAQCRRCGWVGSSEELTEDDAQCTRDAGDRLCLGDCDELERHDLLNIIQAMAAAQPHPEPIAWMVGTAIWWTKEEAERDAAATGLPVVTIGPMPTRQDKPAWFMTEGGVSAMHAQAKAMSDQQGLDTSSYCVPLYMHADPGEVDRLRNVIEQQRNLIASLRAELAESRSIDASAEPTAAIEIDHDALIAAVCVLRSQGLGNLSQAVEVARAALERKPY